MLITYFTYFMFSTLPQTPLSAGEGQTPPTRRLRRLDYRAFGAQRCPPNRVPLPPVPHFRMILTFLWVKVTFWPTFDEVAWLEMEVRAIEQYKMPYASYAVASTYGGGVWRSISKILKTGGVETPLAPSFDRQNVKASHALESGLT